MRKKSQDHPPSGPEVSRRAFLVGASTVGVMAAIEGRVAVAAPAGAAAEEAAAAAGAVPVTLRVNGQRAPRRGRSAHDAARCLRETLQLTGTKKGCDHGQCGACTVHVERPARELVPQLARDARGRRDHDDRGPRRAGRAASDAGRRSSPATRYQCGYCTSGQIMSAVALLEEPCGPDRRRRAGAMSGNICRCGAYPNIVAAIQQVAERRRARTPAHAVPLSSFARAGRPRRRSPRRAGEDRAAGRDVRFLAGGTTLVDLMKLDVERPERLRRHQPPAARPDRAARPTAGSRSAPRCATPTLAQHPRPSSATTRCCRRRSSPARRRSCATWRRPRAISCSARAACTSATPRCPATSASPAPAAPRSTAPTACSRSSARASTASPPTRPTCAWRWRRSRRRSTCAAPKGERRDPVRRLPPAARRHARARDRARAGRSHHARHAAAAGAREPLAST